MRPSEVLRLIPSSSHRNDGAGACSERRQPPWVKAAEGRLLWRPSREQLDKRLLLGEPLEKVVNRDSMQNPGSLAWFVEFAAKRQAALS